jgi:hypothetical protein
MPEKQLTACRNKKKKIDISENNIDELKKDHSIFFPLFTHQVTVTTGIPIKLRSIM